MTRLLRDVGCSLALACLLLVLLQAGLRWHNRQLLAELQDARTKHAELQAEWVRLQAEVEVLEREAWELIDRLAVLESTLEAGR